MSFTNEPETMDFMLAQISHMHFNYVRQLFDGLGLSRGQPSVLRELWGREGLTHTELAANLHITPATVTKMLQRMKKSGFIITRPDPNDQRISRVYLTDAGREIQSKVFDTWKIMEQDEFEGFSAEELIHVRQVLTKIRHNLAISLGDQAYT